VIISTGLISGLLACLLGCFSKSIICQAAIILFIIFIIISILTICKGIIIILKIHNFETMNIDEVHSSIKDHLDISKTTGLITFFAAMNILMLIINVLYIVFDV
jgi:hypothetical protein